MSLAWTFGAESLVPHPFRKERGKEWGTPILVGSAKGWASHQNVDCVALALRKAGNVPSVPGFAARVCRDCRRWPPY